MRLDSRLGPLLLALSITPLTSLSASAQAPAADADQMTIHVTVSARNGDPVEGLTKDDFTLTDNKRPEPIISLKALPPTQTDIIVVLDAVNLPYNLVSFARQQLADFFSANGGHLAQPTTFGVLQDSGLKIQPGVTTDGNSLRASLDSASIGLRALTRAAGVYGAEDRLQISLRAFQSLVDNLPQGGAKRIIWISPGWPLLSGPDITLSNAQTAAIFAQVVAINTKLRRSNTIVDAVNPGGATEDIGRANYYENFLRAPRTTRDIQLGQLGLQVIAQQSGGLVLNGSNDIAGLLRQTVALTKGGYELTFTPAPGEHNNEYHELQLKVQRPGLAVHTIAGYYARPVFPDLPQPVPEPAVVR
jgi:VWFA-related protein